MSSISPLSTSSSWSGRVVARILPKGVPMDYNQLNKPLLAQVPPSTYVPGTGMPALRPTFDDDIKRRRRNASQLSKEESSGDGSTSSTVSVSAPTSSSMVLHQEQSTLSSFEVGEDTDDDGLSMRIEFYVFPPTTYHVKHQHHRRAHHNSVDGEQDIVSLVLVRKRYEPITQCFKRMQLSLAKKLKSYFLDHDKMTDMEPNKKKVNKKELASFEVSCFLVVDEKEIKLEGSSMADMKTEDFWSSLPSKSIQIVIRVEGAEATEIPMVVDCNPPTLTRVSTFEKFHSKIFPGVPLVVEVETMHATHAVVDWYIDHQLVCHDSSWYMPTSDFAQKSVGVVITPTRPDHDGKGFAEAYEFAEKIEEILPENTLLQTRPDWLLPRESTNSDELRVMSYNILADQNAYSMTDGQPFFPWVTAATLNRARRMPLILHEILSYHPDVVCLQEVDEVIFETLFRPCMRCFGYQGCYHGKKSDGTREGCATFFSLAKFQEASKTSLKAFEVSQLLTEELPRLDQDDVWRESAKPILDLLASRSDLHKLIKEKLGHILQLASLQDKRGNPLLVANTHLFYHPGAPHIRALQCFAIAYKLCEEQKKASDAPPFILCGDFNSELWNCGALLMQRQTPKNFCVTGLTDWREALNTFNWEDDPLIGRPEFDNDFPPIALPVEFPDLVSAYPDYPKMTHCVVGFQATLDHILMTPRSSQGSLTPLRQAPIPAIEKVTRDVAMPSVRFPSDHMSVIADVMWEGKIA